MKNVLTVLVILERSSDILNLAGHDWSITMGLELAMVS